MRQQEATEPLRFRYRAKLGPGLLALLAALILGALLVHAARSGLRVPSRSLGRLFAFDPALLWWSAAVLVFGSAIICLRGVFNALGPGKTITLTEENLIFSGRSAIDRERIPYRTIQHARCVDLSTTTATIVIRFGHVEKHLSSGLFESLPDFYAFWSALRTRVQPAAVQTHDAEGFEQHGSKQRALESLLGPKGIALGCGIGIVVVAAVFGFRYWFGGMYRSPVAAPAAVPWAAPTVATTASTARPIFLSERIITEIQRSEFARLHLAMPLDVPLEQTSWVVDRRQQIYFVAQGGGHHDIPYLFTLVLPRDGITVHVEGEVKARGPVEPGGVEIDWDITSVKVPKEHAASAPRCLDLVRHALQAYGYYGDTALAKAVRVRLPSPTFT